MDFLDPKKDFRHKILLFSGYFLISIAILIGTIILLYESYGYGINQNGQVIQNGLVYLSSTPNPASIYVNGKYKTTTNTSFTLPSGIYNFSLYLSGYRTWNRQIEIDGGSIVYFDYPLLIPNKLKTQEVKSYNGAPPIFSQSPNKQLLLVMIPNSKYNFDLYNLNNLTQAPSQISLPSNTVSNATSSESWQIVSWANDNQHVLLKHIYDGKTEYILFNTTNPNQSLNLTQTFNTTPFDSISLVNNNYDQYYLLNSSTQTLYEVSLSNPTQPTIVLNNVINFDPYLTNTILYATSKGAPSNEVFIEEKVGNSYYHIKTLVGGTTYLLNEASYNGVIYVACGAESENKVYIYRDPVSQLNNNPKQMPVPSQVLFVKNPNYLSFSDNAQFIMAENGSQFGVFDIVNQHGYNYNSVLPLQSPQAHATWMDGDRLSYVSGNKLVMFEYDHNYAQTLETASPNYSAFFDPNYKYIINVAQNQKNSNFSITKTSLVAS